MAHRLGIFLAAVIFGFGILVARPWIPGEDGVAAIIISFGVLGLITYTLIRGFGWVLSGK
jgi:uncharacterized membrane protein